MIRALFVVLSLATLVGGTAAPGEEIEVDFVGGRYDRWLFRPEVGLTRGRWDTMGQGLHAVLPRGNADRGPMRFLALMRLEGDFEVLTQFSIGRLPRPVELKIKDPSNNIEI